MILNIQRPYGHKDAGHQQVIVEEDVDLAQQLFAEAIGNGYMAYARIGGEMQVVTELPTDAEEVTMTLPMAGG